MTGDEGLFPLVLRFLMTERRKKRKRSQNWTLDETRHLLIHIKALTIPPGGEINPKSLNWDIISEEMVRMGFQKNPKQCEVKYNNLARSFRRALESEMQGGMDRKNYLSKEVFDITVETLGRTFLSVESRNDSPFSSGKSSAQSTAPTSPKSPREHSQPIQYSNQPVYVTPPQTTLMSIAPYRFAPETPQPPKKIRYAKPLEMTGKYSPSQTINIIGEESGILQEILKKQKGTEDILKSVAAICHKTLQNQLAINQNVEFLINLWKEEEMQKKEANS